MKKLEIRVAMSLLVIAALTTAAPAQTLTVLHNFGTQSGDPLDPVLGYWAQGRDGNLYSTAPTGGAHGDGAVFSFSVSTGLVTVLHSFAGTDGSAPYSGLTLGTDGNFYGTTSAGGEYGAGTVFQITPAGTFTTLYNFTNGSDGGTPIAPPVEGADGNFYGTTSTGGAAVGCGTVYSITTSVTTPTILHQFAGSAGSDGCDPVAPLVLGNDGYFYGTTYRGGTSVYQAGTVFQISPAGSLVILHSFSYADGFEPNGLILGIDGNFYGTTTVGGTSGSGEVFEITSAGTPPTILYSFTGGSDGAEPYTGLVQATDQQLYGVTVSGGTGYGNIFTVNPTAPYAFASLYSFVPNVTGETPEAPLFQSTDGLLYGDTSRGGSNGEGTIFSLNLNLPPFVRLQPYSGDVGTTIGILGLGFTGAKSVAFNGTAATFNVSSDAYITATVPSGATTGPVTVTTLSGNTLTSNQVFTVIKQSGLSPASGTQGQTLDVAITGAGFVNGVTTANFGPYITVNSVTATDADDAVANITIAPHAPAKQYVVTLTTGKTKLNVGNFAVIDAVWSFSPTSAIQGQTLDVAITGVGFVNGVTTANFGPNITVNSVTVTDSDDATANITISPAQTILKKYQVSVTTGTFTERMQWFVVQPAVWSFTPTSAIQGQTLDVAITGVGFVNGVTTVNFGPNITVNSVTVTDSDDATANITISPAQTTLKKYQVSVTTGAFTGSMKWFVVQPAVWSFSPTSAIQGQTLDVAITGVGFVNGVTTANFGPNITVNSVTVTDSDDATANITISPAQTTLKKYQVSVTTGAFTGSMKWFVVQPAVWSFSPTSAIQGQTLDVAIAGVSFVNGVTTVHFGPPLKATPQITVNSVMVADSNHATANVTISPAQTTLRKYEVSVTTGTFTGSMEWFVVQPAVWSLNPTSGIQGQTLDVAITGVGFVNGVTTANFGPHITVNSVTVTDSDDATANITIAPNATVKNYLVYVMTGAVKDDLGDFTVQP